MKKLKKLNLVALLTIVLLTIISNPQISKAADKYVSNMAADTKQKVGNVTFVSKQYKVGSSYYCKIIMKKDGKSKTIDKKTTAAFVTNGKVLYYVKEGKLVNDYGQHKNTIYKYTIKTGKKEKIITGPEYTIRGCSGTYLYYGTDNWADGVDLYAINVKTKKKKHMVDTVGRVFISGSRVVTTMNSGAPEDYPIHSFKLNGTGKKKISDGNLLNVKNGKIYYYKTKLVNEKNETIVKYKVYRCSETGKSKKALTEWVSEVPEKYYDKVND